LRQSLPQIPVLVVTQHSHPAYIEEAFRCGASGYILKRNIVSELIAALERVRSGGRYLSPGLEAA
jgi:DNA-binding NarL/FixJ family response regulator